jgi:hypothetical protein
MPCPLAKCTFKLLDHLGKQWQKRGAVWNNFKNIVDKSTERFVPRKALRKNSDPEYYNKEIKRLKSKVRKEYNKRKLGVCYTEKLKQL